jgi:hypothetical protein
MEKTVKNIENVVISVQKLTQIHSTGVENIRQINLFLQNKPNFPNFPPKNEDFAKKQTQFKPNSNPIQTQFSILDVSSLASLSGAKPILGQYQGWQTQTNPKQTQFFTINVSSPCFGVYPELVPGVSPLVSLPGSVCLPIVLPGVKPNGTQYCYFLTSVLFMIIYCPTK